MKSKLKIKMESSEGVTKKLSQNGQHKRTDHAMRAKITINENYLWWSCLLAITFFAFASRLYKIDEPDHICWDETHFGKMGSYYLNHTFFFDVHPPLGKMMIAAFGHMTGYNGSFAFSKPGDKYGGVSFVGMRVCCACLGSCLIPISFGSTWLLTKRLNAAVFSSIIVLCDTGVLTLSQYILLDTPLLFFIMAAAFCLLMFQEYHKKPFSPAWWLWLSLTGASLSCAIRDSPTKSIHRTAKSAMTMAWMRKVLGEKRRSRHSPMKQMVSGGPCSSDFPIALSEPKIITYFNRMRYDSRQFRCSEGRSPTLSLSLYFSAFSFGSIVTIKNHRTGGAYLHSHWHLYPDGVGAKQQQVTTYSHKDDNNRWLVSHFNRRTDHEDGEAVIVRNGDLIRLQHVTTGRNLHSHKEVAPITKNHYQVTCYGENGTGDANDIFRVELINAIQGNRDPVRTVRSVFRLVHMNTGCSVHSHNKQLPKWGWEQLEVSCNPRSDDKKNFWNIEEVRDNRLPNTSFEVYAPSFSEKILESHAVMFQGNSGLKPKEGEGTSRPWQWPINYRGQPFSGGQYRIYLLGNPVLWWGVLVAMTMYLLISLVHAIRRQRGFTQNEDAIIGRTLAACHWYFCAWLLHYLPFWPMTRVLYFHHYFPAWIFSAGIAGCVLDLILEEISTRCGQHSWSVHHALCGILTSGIVYSFCTFLPLSYGMSGPPANNVTSNYHHLKWLDTWDI
ncbi:hypothetical protein CAPTEDRAFT_152537 [Capitella teleta]|uniref:Protein O-mannosyl-transferase 2 n=2 Tax=Capitella teleta TaxID=283909 RepID=R7TR66_CAPTE|nr:hypothetical protein CAPTEDRAFT_152537 [Capitella teleta]|eukprot:ELT93986.1 hypothetical protein CAPTEDRAFT_152537 [Capitella teleta]